MCPADGAGCGEWSRWSAVRINYKRMYSMERKKSKLQNVPLKLIPPAEETEVSSKSGLLNRLSFLFEIHFIAYFFLAIAVIIGLFGYLFEHKLIFNFTTFSNAFYANISTELISISITVLVIERLIRKREENELKRQLVRELRSTDSAITMRALDELNARGWSIEGVIRRAHLLRANFKGAYLKNVDLSYAWMREANFENSFMQGIKLKGAVLVGANFLGAKALTATQLSEATMLLAAIMPNGKTYDGRFNLEGDLKVAKEYNFDISDPQSAAKFYGISKEAFVQGQTLRDEGVKLDDDIYIKDNWLDKYLPKKWL